jgi:hypothetical protein
VGAGNPAPTEENHKVVVYPHLWKTLWRTSVQRLIPLALAVGLLVVLGELFGYVRALVGVVLFYLVFVVSVRYMHFLVTAPPDPEVADVSDYGLKYVCTMCGLELRVEVAAKDRAPTHCMEPMVLVRDGGRAEATPT